MKNIDFIYRSNDFTLTFDDDSLTSVIDYNLYFKQAKTANLRTLISDKVDSPYLSGTAEKIAKKQIEFEFDLPDSYVIYKKWLSNQSKSIITKSLINFIDRVQSNNNFGPIVHPDNLIVDNFDNLWIANRFLKNSKTDVFEDLKILVVSSLSKLNFSDLDNDNGIDLLNDQQLNLYQSKNYQELTDLMVDLYQQYLESEKGKQVLVSRRGRLLTRIVLIASLVLIPVLIFFLLNQSSQLAVQKEKFEVTRLLNQAVLPNEDSKKRNQNIYKLLKNPAALKILTNSQKREVAYYVIQNSDDLQDNEKEDVLKNYDSNNRNNYTRDKDFVMYWILIGKKDYQKSFDIASSLNHGRGDVILKRVSLENLLDQIKNNKNLSAKERKAREDELDSTVKEVNDELKKYYRDTDSQNSDDQREGDTSGN